MQVGNYMEWANVFTCMCVALGHDARLCIEWTGDAWTEVYVEEFRRWIHIDCCKKLYQAPDTYESRWKKKLTYVIAFSPHEVVDVTLRYVADQKENLKRREEVDEDWLDKTLGDTREQLWKMQGPGKAELLRQRYEKEEQEMLI